MKSPLTRLLAAVAAFCLATSAYGLTIIPTFDISITTNVNVVAITNAISAAIRVMQSNVVDNVTVNITFVSDENVGLGQSLTFGEDVAYSDFLTALKSHATSSRDNVAYGRLPNSLTDPVVGGSQGECGRPAIPEPGTHSAASNRGRDTGQHRVHRKTAGEERHQELRCRRAVDQRQVEIRDRDRGGCLSHQHRRPLAGVPLRR